VSSIAKVDKMLHGRVLQAWTIAFFPSPPPSLPVPLSASQIDITLLSLAGMPGTCPFPQEWRAVQQGHAEAEPQQRRPSSSRDRHKRLPCIVAG
jgi:hypothetical protein